MSLSSANHARNASGDGSSSPTVTAMVEKRSGTASVLWVRAWSIITAFARPWCMSVAVPRAWARECTTRRPFWKAIAPIIDATSMAPRASRSRIRSGA